MTSGVKEPEARESRRVRRFAAAAMLLESPPPLDGLAVRCVTVDRTSVLHASRSRPVVRWDLTVESAGGGRSPLGVIGKGFIKGGGQEACWLLSQLRAAGFDDPTMRVPQPYGYDPGRRLLAQEEAPAQTLYDLLHGKIDASAASAGRVARWLARLHAVTGVALPPLATDFEGMKLVEYGRALETTLPAASVRVTELVETTTSMLAAAATDPLVLTHGDFQPKNVHLDPSRVVVIDFDRAAYAPAARDLGHFIGQTETMGAALHGDLRAAAAWVDVFLDEYVAGGGSPLAVASTPGYVARTFAEVLYYRLVVRPVPDPSFVPVWLDAWERHVSGEVLL